MNAGQYLQSGQHASRSMIRSLVFAGGVQSGYKCCRISFKCNSIYEAGPRGEGRMGFTLLTDFVVPTNRFCPLDIQVLSILAFSHDLGVFYGRWRLSQSGVGADSLIIYVSNASGVLGPPVGCSR
jgi:hypothetical protein